MITKYKKNVDSEKDEILISFKIYPNTKTYLYLKELYENRDPREYGFDKNILINLETDTRKNGFVKKKQLTMRGRILVACLDMGVNLGVFTVIAFVRGALKKQKENLDKISEFHHGMVMRDITYLKWMNNEEFAKKQLFSKAVTLGYCLGQKHKIPKRFIALNPAKKDIIEKYALELDAIYEASLRHGDF